MRWRIREVITVAIGLASCGGAGARTASAPSDEPQASPVASYTAEIVATFPHAADAFTQGLELHAGRLYESTGLHGRSTLRVVELETGEVLRQREVSSTYYAEGLTVLDGRAYQLTYQSGVCFVYDAETLVVTAERAYAGEGWGLTHHEGALVMSDGTPVLRVLDPETFAERRRITVRDGRVPVEELNELEMVEGELFANVWMTDRIARIELETGRVTGWIELPFLREQLHLTEPQAVLNGIAYDADSGRLFVTGKLWPTLFEIRLRRSDA